MTAYAELADLLALFETPPNATRQTLRLEPLLEEASQELTGELRRDYFRHPATGADEVWLIDGDGTGWLHVHGGLLELEQLEVSFDGGRTFEVLDSSDYELTWSWGSSDPPPDDEPYFHVRLVPGGSRCTFPRGTGTVRATGARGWATVPAPLVEATAERARQIAYADPSYQGSIPSDEMYGQPTTTSRWPDVLYRFMAREARRFRACEQ